MNTAANTGSDLGHRSFFLALTITTWVIYVALAVFTGGLVGTTLGNYTGYVSELLIAASSVGAAIVLERPRAQLQRLIKARWSGGK